MMAEKRAENFNLEELTALLPLVENASIEISDKVIEDIKKEIETKVYSGRLRLSADDCHKFFEVDIYNKSVTWNNNDKNFIFFRFLIYAKRLVESFTKQGINNARTAIFCLGQAPEGEATTSNNNIDYVGKLCKEYNIPFAPFSAETTVTATSKPKPEKTEAQKKSELRKQATPASDRNAPATMPKIKAPTAPTTTPEQADDRCDLAQVENQDTDINIPNILVPLALNDILNAPELDFLTDNLIVRNSVNVFFAPAKTGKTYLCLHYAVCLAMGIPFLGLENHLKRNIGYLNLDMGRIGFIDRVKQVIKGIKPFATNEDIEMVLDRIKIIDRETLRSVSAKTPNFYKNENLNDLKFFIETNDIEILFIDTFSRVRSGSNENDADNMGTTLQNIESFLSPLDCGCVVIHHTGKSGDIRGSMAIVDNADFVFGLKKVDNDNKHLQLYSDYPRYVDDFSIDVYPVIQEIVNPETGAKRADSYLLMTVNPDDDKSNIIDYLLSIGNTPTSRRSIAGKAGGGYQANCKKVDALYLEGRLDRRQVTNGYVYWVSEKGLKQRN